MAIHQFTIAADETGDFETKLSDRGTHAIHCGVVLARISEVFDQTLDRPHLDAHRHRGGLILRRGTGSQHSRLQLDSYISVLSFIRQQKTIGSLSAPAT